MKKFLVLTLVLGIASLASAGLSLATDGSSNVTIVGADHTDAISYTVFLLLTDAPSATPTMNYGGSASAINDYSANNSAFETQLSGAGYSGVTLAKSYQVVIQDGEPFDDIPNGTLVTALVSSGDAYLMNESATTVIDMVSVPEPATLALLGLGALVLRRRK